MEYQFSGSSRGPYLGNRRRYSKIIIIINNNKDFGHTANSRNSTQNLSQPDSNSHYNQFNIFTFLGPGREAAGAGAEPFWGEAPKRQGKCKESMEM